MLIVVHAPRFNLVPCVGIYQPLATTAPAREVFGLRGILAYDVSLSLIGRIAPDPGLVFEQQAGQAGQIMDIDYPSSSGACPGPGCDPGSWSRRGRGI